MREDNLIKKSDIQLAFPKKDKKGVPIANRRKRCRCTLGHNHDSQFEARHCNHLNMLVKAGEIKSFLTQVGFDLHGVNGKKVSRHYPDFLITNNNDTQLVHECKSKGTCTQVWKLKKALFELEYTDIPYETIWM